jgi:dihydropteroate synthase
MRSGLSFCSNKNRKMIPAPQLWQCVDRALDLASPVVMGVLNVTPDSFSDGGQFTRHEAALVRARRMIEEGAAIIDVGGESTRPGASAAGLEEELARVIPLIEAIRRESPVFISVDTSKPEVMRAAVAAGADIINDVRALQEPGALEAAATTRAGVCLMHMQGEPRTMQDAPSYSDVVVEVRDFLISRIRAAHDAGIGRERVTIDPGFGFGKRAQDNLALLKHLADFAPLHAPVLVGLSRKSMLAKITGRPMGERIAGSVALAAIAVLNGARIVRAHDVGPTVDAVRVAAATEKGEAFDGT